MKQYKSKLKDEATTSASWCLINPAIDECKHPK